MEMALSDKYDQFYKTDRQARAISDYPIRKWPRNRVEAIVAVEGSGESIMDIGCGDGSLLYQFRNRYSSLIGLEYSAERLRQAEANLAALKFTPVQGSAEDMSQLADNSVDRIITADGGGRGPGGGAAARGRGRGGGPGGGRGGGAPSIA